MLHTELEKGKGWVEQQIARLAADVEIPLDDVRWSRSADDEKRNVHSISFMLAESLVEEKFTEENLIHVSKDRRLRARVEHRLKVVFKACGFTGHDDGDDVLDETEGEDKGIEFRYSITSYGADYPVDGLVRRLTDGDIFIPPFQRKFVWNPYQSSRFVESLLLGLPVPAIFLAKEEESRKLLVIDGQQRLRSLWHFYQGSFENGSEFVLTGISSRFDGLSYRTLPPSDRRQLDDAILHAIIVKQDEPEGDHSSSIYLLFERLNTGGALLHPQEIRACIYYGPLNDLLATLNKDSAWRAVYGAESQRMKDRELILRFFALMFNLDGYSKPMEGALNSYMAKNRRCLLQSEEQLRRAFLPTIEHINNTLGAEAFRPARAINAAVFDSVMVGLARRLAVDPDISRDQLRNSYSDLLGSTEYKNAYEGSTSDEEKVKTRIRLAFERFSKTI